MRIPEHYAADVLFFFDGHPEELALYEALFRTVEAAFPEGSIRPQPPPPRPHGRHPSAAPPLPAPRPPPPPRTCLVVTVGLGYRLESPRVAVASEPYPGRWTHHILVTEAGQIDEELMGWLQEAWDFAESKR